MALVCVADYEREAAKKLAKSPWDYYQSGAGDGLSLRLNRNAFDRQANRDLLFNKNVHQNKILCLCLI